MRRLLPIVMFVVIAAFGFFACPPKPSPTPSPSPTETIVPTAPPTTPPPNPCPDGKCLLGFTNSIPPQPICGPCPTPKPEEACVAGGLPLPPPAYQITVKVHNAFCANLDSTVKVKDAAYCAAIGFAPNSVCPTRLETDPTRPACDAVALGGGQTWSCTGCQIYPCSVAGNCECNGMKNTNPAQAIYIGTGTVKSCNAPGIVCGSLEVH